MINDERNLMLSKYSPHMAKEAPVWRDGDSELHPLHFQKGELLCSGRCSYTRNNSELTHHRKLMTDNLSRSAKLLMTVYQQCLPVKDRDGENIIQKMRFWNE